MGAIQIRDILNPQSIAIIGASNNSKKWSNEIMRNIIESGYEGEIYPINTKDDQVLGLKARKSLLDIPGTVDMICVCIAAKYVPEIIKQAVEKKVKSAVIFSSGFREAGRRDLEEDILNIIKDSELRIIGPNVQGIINTSNKLHNIFNMSFPLKGNVGVVAQSGSVSAFVTEKMDRRKIGISAMINLGNQIDLCESDFIEYFSEDINTDVIAMYLEGPKDKNRFKEAIIKAAPKKPIVLLKPGSTNEGQKTASSHTGSMAGNDTIFTYACKQFGIVRCKNTTEYIDTIIGFSLCNIPKGNRAVIFSSSGGMGSIATDELYQRGLKLAQLPEEAIEEIKSVVGEQANIGGVMDFAEALDNWEKTIDILNEKYEDCFDIYFFMIADGLEGMEHIIEHAAKKTQKTLIVSYMTDGKYKDKQLEHFYNNKIAIYETPDRAAEVLKNMCWYNEKFGV
jgi:acyl-CoA synthetase (NDP forming)